MHRKERIYENYASILVVVGPVILFITPIVGGYFIGRPHPEALKTITGLTIGIAIAAFPFRNGLRFAWYASWVWPAYLAGYVVSTAILTSQLGENSGVLASKPAGFVVFLVIALLGQLLPVRHVGLLTKQLLRQLS